MSTNYRRKTLRMRVLSMLLGACALGAMTAPARAAVTEANFQMRTGADLVALCSPAQGDALATAAINFCHGFAIGVYQTLASQQPALPQPLFCIPSPPPTRNQTMADLVSWARSTPSAMSERPADAVLDYLTQRFPCAPARARR